MENRGEIIIYQADSGKPQIEVKLNPGQAWDGFVNSQRK